jgi:hypothetical protein
VLTASERFWSKVIKGPGCWEYMGAQRGGEDGKRYGAFWYCGAHVGAHVFSFAQTNGYWPKEKVCHTCDFTLCVRPDHLFEGTTQQNTADRDAKGRQAKGERQHLAKMTEDDVRSIRQEHAAGANYRQLAKKHGVWWTTIKQIVLRRTWKHIE